MVNGVTPAMWRVQPNRRSRTLKVPENSLPDDVDGSATIAFLRKVRKAALLVSGDYAGSLGLHPVVYFYSATGRFQPAAFLAAIRFVLDLKERDGLFPFTEHRRDFEEFFGAAPGFRESTESPVREPNPTH
jgi:hypothetical protein